MYSKLRCSCGRFVDMAGAPTCSVNSPGDAFKCRFCAITICTSCYVPHTADKHAKPSQQVWFNHGDAAFRNRKR